MTWRLIHTVVLLLTFCRVGVAFDFAEVRAQAQALAAQPFQSSTNPLPEPLAELSYVDYEAIRFNPQKGPLARGGPAFSN